MLAVLIAFVASLVCALIVIPIASAVARRVGLVDLPDNKRKLHKNAIPLVGGLSVFIAVVATAPLVLYFGYKYQSQLIGLGNDLFSWIPVDFARRVLIFRPEDSWQLSGLLIGSSILLIVGILDDRFGIRGRQKLFGQFVATTVLIIFGYHFDQVDIAGITIKFDVFSVFFVYAWVIAAINSVNLLDGADGIAGTIGIVMSLSLCLMAVYLGQMVNAIIAVSVAGGLAGFMFFNFPPAKVYLGDTGSMLIGFVLSALAIRSTFKQTSAFAFFAPMALLAIPFIDTAAAIIRRRLTGRSIFAVDRGHLHHSLMKHGYSPRVSLLWVSLLCLTTATGGVLSLIYKQSEYAVASIGIVIIVMLVCRIFGVAEFQLVTRKAQGLAKSLINPRKEKSNVQQSTVHVQGSRNWNQVWNHLAKFADEHKLLELTLDLNAPWMHESFHATHRRKDMPRGGNHEWYVQLPLIAGGRLFGRIELIGSGQEELSHRELVQRALVVTDEIEQAFLASEKLAHGETEVRLPSMSAEPETIVEDSKPPHSSSSQSEDSDSSHEGIPVGEQS
ncbi:MAG: MraY family glycosyltransferase [Planctomycetota bacterium]